MTAALVACCLAAPAPLRAEIIVTQGDSVTVPLVIRGAPLAQPPAVIFLPQPPALGQLPIGGTPNYGTLRSSQSNLERLLGRTDRLRGASGATGNQTVIMFK